MLYLGDVFMDVGFLQVLARSKSGQYLVIGVTGALRPIDVTTAVLEHLRLMDMLRATSAQYLVP
jgi:hypothetical protein